MLTSFGIPLMIANENKITPGIHRATLISSIIRTLLCVGLLYSIAGIHVSAQSVDTLNHPQNYAAVSAIGSSGAQALVPVPALPTMGAAGSIIKDPTYGTRILRCTDAATLTSRGYTNHDVVTTSSAESNAWNKDGTIFYSQTQVTDAVLLYDFNPATFQCAIRADNDGSGFIHVGGAPDFSYTNVDSLYGSASLTFTKWSVSAKTLTTLFNFSTAVPGITGTNGDASVSQTEILVAPACGTAQDLWTCVIAYEVNSPNQYAVLDFTQGIKAFGAGSFTTQTTGAGWNPAWTIHNARIGKEGRYVSITSSGGIVTWDLQTNSTTSITSLSGHKAQGYGTEAFCAAPGGDYGPQVGYLNLANSPTVSYLYPAGPGPTFYGTPCDYMSWQHATSGVLVPALATNEAAGGAGSSNYVGYGQVMAIRTDQVVPQIWEFVHTRAPYYSSGPLPLFSGWLTVNAGGSGYAVNDTGTISGCGTADAVYKVLTVSTGAVATFSITFGGQKYVPATACTTTATSGAGTGFTINISSSLWNVFYNTTRGNASQDGKYMLFNSTWEGTMGLSADTGTTPRVDVFIAELTPLTPQYASAIAPGSTQAVFKTLAPDTAACTATIYSDAGRTTTVTSASDTVRDIRNSQILVTGLTASTHYWTSLACGASGLWVLKSDFFTRPSGSGTYNFTFDWSSATAMRYSTSATMTSPTSLGAATHQVVPVTTNSVIYAQVGTTGPITVLLAP